MARQFKILENNNADWLFLDRNAQLPSEYVSYRHFICHGIHDLLQIRKMETDECRSELNKLKEAIINKTNYLHKDFVRLYQINNLNENIGCVVVDETRWCYPLIFDNEKRIKALENSINDIGNNLEKIIEVLRLYKVWDEDIQENLERLYTLPR